MCVSSPVWVKMMMYTYMPSDFHCFVGQIYITKHYNMYFMAILIKYKSYRLD